MTGLVVFSVIDIVLLVAGLAVYLYWVGTLLTRVAGNLEECAEIVQTIVGHAKLIGPGVGHINETGGVVVWRAADTQGTPPPELAQRFPGLVPEVPRAFDWLVNGRQPLLRIGWAIVRPKTP